VTTLVLDASVALKWALPAADEPLKPEAFRLLQRYVDDEIQLIVPDIFWAECGNALWKAVRRGRQSRASAELALSLLVRRNFTTLPSASLLPRALAIALDFGRTFYDSLYVALAVATKCDFVTADERLANALAAYLPVKWLGTF